VAYKDFLNLLGIGVRASKYELGTFACEKALKQNRLKLLILDKGLAPKTIKSFNSLCEDNGVELVMIDKGDFQNRTGMTYGVIGVKNKNFAEALINKLNLNHLGDK
jgi:ribosomal protein L7Ae-like RNA K-turn-binding protein